MVLCTYGPHCFFQELNKNKYNENGKMTVIIEAWKGNVRRLHYTKIDILKSADIRLIQSGIKSTDLYMHETAIYHLSHFRADTLTF